MKERTPNETTETDEQINELLGANRHLADTACNCMREILDNCGEIFLILCDQKGIEVDPEEATDIIEEAADYMVAFPFGSNYPGEKLLKCTAGELKKIADGLLTTK